VSVADVYDETAEGWERSYRYPLYERMLWLVSIAALVGAIVGRSELRQLMDEDRRRGLAAVAVIAFFGLLCLWISFRAWQSKVIISPTSLKGWYFMQGHERISWGNIDEVLYHWRLIGHKLTFVGTDGARVRFRSSISGYDELLSFIRANSPEHIADQLEELFGEEEEEEYEEEEEEIEEEEEEKEEAEDEEEEIDEEEEEEEEDEEEKDEKEKKRKRRRKGKK